MKIEILPVRLIHLSLYYTVCLLIVSQVSSDGNTTLPTKKAGLRRIGDYWCHITKSYESRDVHYSICTEKTKDFCGWFSFTKCTYYRKVICKEESNTTTTHFYKEWSCCDGFVQLPNRTCANETLFDPETVELLKNQTLIENERDKYEVTESWKGSKDAYREPPIPHHISVTKKSTFSQGAYAGMACAALFLIVIAVFIGIAIKKKRRNQRKMKTSNGIDRSAERVAFHRTPIVVVKSRSSSKASVAEDIEKVHLNAEET